MINIRPRARRVLQAVLYELVAIIVVGPVTSLVFAKSLGSAVVLAFILSTLALVWSYVFNYGFERWEAKQSVKGRSALRRLAHGAGFEGGLVFLSVPVMAWWLEINWLAAFITELGVLLFYFFYALAFTWTFDKIFGLPESAR